MIRNSLGGSPGLDVSELMSYPFSTDRGRPSLSKVWPRLSHQSQRDGTSWKDFSLSVFVEFMKHSWSLRFFKLKFEKMFRRISSAGRATDL